MRRLSAILIFVIISISGMSQNFGNLGIPVERKIVNRAWEKNETYSFVLTKSFWSQFNNDSFLDGNCVKYFRDPKYFPKSRKMEGNVKNSKMVGVWKIYDAKNELFIKGSFVNDKKEGLWKAYKISKYGDSVLIYELHFKNDNFEGKQSRMDYKGRCEYTCNYQNGLKDGCQIEYLYRDTMLVPWQIENYKLGQLHGTRIIYNEKMDTVEYEVYKDGKRDGRCFYYISNTHRNHSKEFADKYIIDFKDGKLNGKLLKYYSNGKLAFDFDCKDDLPLNINSSLDTNSMTVNIGHLKNGTGNLKVLFDNGSLRSEYKYKYQLCSGEFCVYIHPKELLKSGKLNCVKRKRLNGKKFNVDIVEVIKHSRIYNLNEFFMDRQYLSKGSEYSVFGYQGKKSLCSKVTHKINDSLYYEDISEYSFSGKIEKKYKVFDGVKFDTIKDGCYEGRGFYKLHMSDSVVYSTKEGVFYYGKKKNPKAVVNYINGKEFGKSLYYDDLGKLGRVKMIQADGSEYNIYYGDTVNKVDSKGFKQGKWLDIENRYSSDDGKCYPIEIKYYKDNKPVGVWETYNSKEQLTKKYDWQDSVYAKYFEYDSVGRVKVEGGYLFNYDNFGVFKEYDTKDGFLKYRSKYNGYFKEGFFVEYNKKGEIVHVIESGYNAKSYSYPTPMIKGKLDGSISVADLLSDTLISIPVIDSNLNCIDDFKKYKVIGFSYEIRLDTVVVSGGDYIQGNAFKCDILSEGYNPFRGNIIFYDITILVAEKELLRLPNKLKFYLR